MLKLTKDQYESLAAELKENFELDGDVYVEKGVATLKRSLDEKDRKLAEKDAAMTEVTTRLAAVEKQFEGIDPKKYAEAVAAAKKIETEKMVSKGDYEAAVAALTSEFEAKEKTSADELGRERKVTKTLLVDDKFRKLLTSGIATDGKTKIPRLSPERAEGALAWLKQTVNPDVLVTGDDRRAVVSLNGVPKPMEVWAMEWLTSDAAAPWVQAPENSGALDSVGGINAGGDAGDSKAKVIPADQRSANLEDLASGKVISDDAVDA